MMKSVRRQYLFGAVFLAFGIFEALSEDYLEFALYGTAGVAFMVNALTFEPKFLPYKKALVILSWTLIIGTGVLFLYLLQFRYL